MPDPNIQTELAAIYHLYAAIAAQGPAAGKLLYLGELTGQSARQMRAANIAGAASLAATADPAIQKQAIREGIADFVVTNLDEALRILKNEIRKKQTVAVCIAAAPAAIEAEIKERGVQPDIAPPEPSPLPTNQIFVIVENPAPGWEAKAQSLIPEQDELNRRWFCLSPRYLGPKARRIRSLAIDREAARSLSPSASHLQCVATKR